MNTETQPSPPIPLLQRHLQLETDLFCFGCGYNLHGQIVTHDERLGFLICRCPECGKFHPAAMGVSATRPWLARLGVMLIAQWVLAVLVVFGIAGLFMGGFTYGHLETYTDYREGPVPDTGITYRTVRVPPTYVVTPGVPNSYSYAYHEAYYDRQWRYMATFSGIFAFALGIFSAVAMWHVSPRARVRVLIYPIVVGVCVLLLWYANEYIDRILGWSIQRISLFTLLHLTCMAAGLAVGRPIARWLVKMLVPPKLRQHVNFLWRCDGKTPPAAAV